MNLEQIKQAIEDGKNVYWENEMYQVVKDSKGEYLIKCLFNDRFIGLTWADGVTLNAKESDFFIA